MVMKQKQLHSLMLNFEPNEEKENGLLSNRMEVVLDVLEPHPDVMELVVHNYLGLKLSRWMESTSILSHMKTLNLYRCINLTKFPAFGQLPSLEVLDIKGAIKVKHIGFEFYSSNSSTFEHVNRVPFPKLKVLRMDGMINLEVWELQHGVVMPCLRLIQLLCCPNLKALPAALGKLPSLEELVIKGADELTHIGCEFLYEVDEEEAAGGEVRFNNTTAFPKLNKLTIMDSKDQLEWEFRGVIAGSGGEEIIMPCLRELSIQGLKNWKPLTEVLSKISPLEILKIWGEATEFVKYIRHDDDDLYISREIILLFPNLKQLRLSGMEDMEELKIGFHVMPLLSSLEIYNCKKLKAIHGGSLSKLELLVLHECESVYELRIPNLTSLQIVGAIHPSLREAFATTLQELEVLIIKGSNWASVPEQVQQLTSLKRLELIFCGKELQQRCRRDEGEDWRFISHIPNIEINMKSITNCN